MVTPNEITYATRRGRVRPENDFEICSSCEQHNPSERMSPSAAFAEKRPCNFFLAHYRVPLSYFLHIPKRGSPALLTQPLSGIHWSTLFTKYPIIEDSQVRHENRCQNTQPSNTIIGWLLVILLLKGVERQYNLIVHIWVQAKQAVRIASIGSWQ